MENKANSTAAPIPAHLSEFVDILKNNKLKRSTSTVFNSTDMEGTNASVSPALLSFGSRNFSTSAHSPQQRRSSQSYAGSMTSSLYQFQTIVSKKDIDNTKKDIKLLQSEFQKFSKQLDEMTKTASNIGAVLENLSNHSKSEDDEMLLNLSQCSGFYHMLGTHQQVLSQTIKQQFLKPLESHMSQIMLKYNEHDKTFKKDFQLNYKNLKNQEKLVMNQKKNHKNLLNYRENIYELENRLSNIENLKIDYYHGSAQLLNEHSKYVLHQVASLIAIQLELHEELAKKGWSGGGLEFVHRMKTLGEDDEEEMFQNEELPKNTTQSMPIKETLPVVSSPKKQTPQESSYEVTQQQALQKSSPESKSSAQQESQLKSNPNTSMNTSMSSRKSVRSSGSSQSGRTIRMTSEAYRNSGDTKTQDVPAANSAEPPLIDGFNEDETSFSLPQMEGDLTDQSSI
ncbi:hypothetical protein ACO0QE_002600 [Hanseniaspora vineae]